MVALLKAGAETDKEDIDGKKALDLTPDNEVRSHRKDFEADPN